MKLKFLLQKNAWFVEHDRAWYCLRDEAQVALAASTMPLTVVDLHGPLEQPHVAGEARLSDELARSETESLFRRKSSGAGVGSVRVTLVEPDGTVVVDESVVLDESTLVSVEWLTAPFRDGWMGTNASLSLDNVRQLELRAFLPAVPGSTGKTLTVRDERDGSATEVWLERAQPTVIPLAGKGRGGRVVLNLECEPETNGDPSDTRQLGFLLLGESIEAA